MSYALSRPSSTQRSSLLLIVIGLHAGLLLLVMAAKTVAPQLMEMPLIVDLLPAPPVEPPPAKPLPVIKPQPVRPKPAAKVPTPVLETTASEQPAPAAPLAAPPEVKPAPAISQARFDADYLRNPAPPYPPLSRRMGEEGKVILRVSVTPEGTADAVDIRSSSGSARLDEAAQKTVRNWRFVAARRGDTAIQSWVLVPIIFKLEQ